MVEGGKCPVPCKKEGNCPGGEMSGGGNFRIPYFLSRRLVRRRFQTKVVGGVVPILEVSTSVAAYMRALEL